VLGGGQEDFRGIEAPVCRIERGECTQKPPAALCRGPQASSTALQCTLRCCTAELRTVEYCCIGKLLGRADSVHHERRRPTVRSHGWHRLRLGAACRRKRTLGFTPLVRF
jgi:hypothetical protein